MNTVRFSTNVLADLEALISHLHSKAGGYDPSAGISPGRILDLIHKQVSAGASGVVELPPGALGGPTQITPVHDALDYLRHIQEQQASYATGIIELTAPHTIRQPVDVNFEDRFFLNKQLDLLPEALKRLVQATQPAGAHLVLVVPDVFRPNTLVLVILLSRHDHWSRQHEKALYQALQSTTQLPWVKEYSPLK